MRSKLKTLALIALAAGLSASTKAWAGDAIRVVAAENFYGELATQIGGKHIEVTSILSNPNEDPHLFESSASTARAVTDAQVVIYNGTDYDPWMVKLLSASQEGNRTIIVAADLTGHKSGDNPHLWYDPKTLPTVAAALATELEKRDPADAADYVANLATFDDSFAEVTTHVNSVKAKYAGTGVTATEPVFGYMAAAMGLKMLNYDFQVAVMNGTEPSPRDVAAFETSLKDGSVKILFYNNQVTDDTTARLLAIAKAGKVAVIGVTETEPQGKTIQTWFAGQIAEVQNALAANP